MKKKSGRRDKVLIKYGRCVKKKVPTLWMLLMFPLAWLPLSYTMYTVI
jgi:hypothetical protein